MAVLGPIDLPASYDHLTLEARLADAWERLGLYRFDPDADGEIFAVDTPPPYVSAAHLHVGHAMSYTQAEVVVRWHRMKGRRTFYPMGFDDNGLPTERYVERTHGIDRSSTTRAEFRALCLEETRRGAAAYEALWRSLGLSVDWSLRYSTIDDHCRATAQRSFVELFDQGRIYRCHDPVLWDPSLQTALAQADLETRTRRQKLYTLRFGAPDGTPLPIATTRPELLPAAVALYHHPDDARYASLSEAIEPLEQRRLPVLTDADVDPSFGTGLMMVCTFGDGEDVRRYKRDGLPLRIRVGPDGRMTADAGPWAGLPTAAARKRIVAALKDRGVLDGFEMIEQAYPVAERSGTPVEWAMAPQWFLRVLDRREALLERSAELSWSPPWMKSRLDHWIEGLRWDWNLSRQRFYGVPFPVWLCTDCQHPVLARIEDLPVDPTEDPPPIPACPACGGTLRGDPDVMDTWMTSSMTPQINANWVGTPGRSAGPLQMDVRVQAFEIIRTWLFYTLIKSDLHHDALPWRQVMISGWGLNEQGKKISKRDLLHSADASGFNRYDPAAVIERWGADALRHWAARATLGQDNRYHAKEVRAGRRVVVKLWNASRLAAMSLSDFDPQAPRSALSARPLEDRDLLAGLDELIEAVDRGLAAYDYASGLAALDRFFFATFCDDWLETIKDRLSRPERYPDGSRSAAQETLYEALRALIGLYAPYLPFVTDGIWLALYQRDEGGDSLHATAFPEPRGVQRPEGMPLVSAVLRTVRALRTEARLPQSRPLSALVIEAPEALHPQLSALEPTLRAACRADQVTLGSGARPVEGTALSITAMFDG